MAASSRILGVSCLGHDLSALPADCTGNPATQPDNTASWACADTLNGGTCATTCSPGYTGAGFTSTCSLGKWSQPAGESCM